MKKNILKFDKINFPIFGLKRPPHKIIYSKDKILCCILPGSSMLTLDDKSLSGDYFSRLLQLESRVKFDYTCNSIQDIIYSGIKWAIDYKGIPIDLSAPAKAKVEKRKIERIENSLVWVRTISYPFDIRTTENISLSEELYAILVHINGVWYLKEISLDSEPLARPYINV